MLSVRDNFLRMMRGETPQYVPNYQISWGIKGGPSAIALRQHPDGSGFDQWGLEWVIGDSSVSAALPKPGQFQLTDITQWRDVIQAPDCSALDWAAMASEDLRRRDFELPWGGAVVPGVGFFESLVAFMGFEAALLACVEEPQEVKALMEYLCDWAVALNKLYIHYYQPDYGFFGDDIAHQRSTFISLATFQELFAPSWRRVYALFREKDIPCLHHNCGYFEPFLDELVKMGVTAWDPVQSMNDAPGIKQRYGNRLALCELYEVRLLAADVSEEEVRSNFREHLLKLAEGGGYALFNLTPGEMGYTADELKRSRWVVSEFERLRYNIYK